MSIRPKKNNGFNVYEDRKNKNSSMELPRIMPIQSPSSCILKFTQVNTVNALNGIKTDINERYI